MSPPVFPGTGSCTLRRRRSWWSRRCSTAARERSPSQIEPLDLSGRRVVQRSTSGTQGVVSATRADAVLLGSFVTAGATARWLSSNTNEVTLVAMGDSGTLPNEEDPACASYLEALL